ARDQRRVLREVLSLKAREEEAPIVGSQRAGLLELAGQDAAAERAVRDEADAELTHRRQDLVFGLAAEHRIFGLQRADRMNCVRRIVAGAASERPSHRTLPSRTSSAIAPTVSSMGVFGSTRCR